jgi:hypothetical protein
MWFLPVNLDVRNEPGEENEINPAVAKNLVRNMDIATFRVSRGWQHKITVVAPGNLIIRLFVILHADVRYWPIADMPFCTADVR